MGSCKDLEDRPAEGQVEDGDDGDHDGDEHELDRRVGEQLLTGRVDHLAQFGDHLADEQGDPRRAQARQAASLLWAATLGRSGLATRLGHVVPRCPGPLPRGAAL